MSYGNVPPPDCLGGRPDRANLDARRAEEAKVQEYHQMSRQYGATTSQKRVDREVDEDYFNASDDEDSAKSKNPAADEDEDDELDAFMASIDAQAKQDVSESKKREEQAVAKGDTGGGGKGRDDIDKEDMEESYYKFLEDYKERHQETAEDNCEYDEDGNVIWTWKKVIDPLPTIDHSQIEYEDFVRDSYEEHEDIRQLSPMEIFELRNKLNLRVFGNDPPKPCASFAHFGLNEKLMNRLRRCEFQTPTPIQAQAIPAALSGRDVLGLAATGSGKTLAYVLPAIVHVLNQSDQKHKSKEAQVRSISDHIRPDRQCLMFSATFQPKIEKLASYSLHNPVKVLCGEVGEANADVIQHVHVLPSPDAKWQWLFARIVQFASEGKVLVFVTKKTDAEIVAEKLKQRDVELTLLHGDMLHRYETMRQVLKSSFRGTFTKATSDDAPAVAFTDPTPFQSTSRSAEEEISMAVNPFLF
ncbi:RNA helicase [Aphelenchoides fujianensis]|nr:RNA helicase [Aphelenchoides fujianensis]